VTPDLLSPSRAALLDRLAAGGPFDLVVVGGGATGLGVALDAASRGLTTALVEAGDFAAGTSSRSTKLVHGGLRYLAHGHLRLVREALRERAVVLAAAPHLAQPLPFLLPLHGLGGRLWSRWRYAAGLRLYAALAGASRLGAPIALGRDALLARSPGLRAAGLVGCLGYVDGQFDDARYAVALARTALARGACVVNHCRVTGLARDGGRHAIEVEDAETHRRIAVAARCVVNATGAHVDALRRLAEPSATDLVVVSQGTHLVVERSFLPGDAAVIVPRTADGRVLFAVPWLGSVILGTTDTPLADPPAEPRPLAAEVDFILAEAARLLARPPGRADVRSAWAGLRPLVRPDRSAGGGTSRLPRDHAIVVDAHGLVTVTGGKWTTYRTMAEDVLAACMERGLVPRRPAGTTRGLRLVGAPPPGAVTTPLSAPPGPHLYGTEAADLDALPGADRWLLPGLSESMVRFAVRREQARTVEDVLARRSRWLFLDARGAARAAPDVAAILADELGAGFPAAASAEAFARRAATWLPAP